MPLRNRYVSRRHAVFNAVTVTGKGIIALAVIILLQAGKIIVAAPIAGKEVAKEIEKRVDELIVLEMPHSFRAVADAYEKWYDVSDEEVLDLLRERIREKELKNNQFNELEV